MGAQTSKEESQASTSPTNEKQNSEASREEEDDEPDEWDKRIFSTGCADENMRMTDCYYDKKDWRACAKEVSRTLNHITAMEEFKQCWKRQGNDERVSTKDA